MLKINKNLGVFSLKTLSEPLQNRVPRVQVLLPLPKRNRPRCGRFLYKDRALHRGARSVPGNAAERALWAKQRGGVGAAVEKCPRPKRKHFSGTARGVACNFKSFCPCQKKSTALRSFQTVEKPEIRCCRISGFSTV